MTYIPFSGAAPSVKNFLGHHTDAILANSDDLLKYKDDMNILAIGTEKRFKPLPDVPTFKELGYDMTPGIQRGVAVPPGTSKKAIKKLESAFLKIVKDPEYQKKMYKDGFEPMSLGSEEAEKYIQEKKKQYSMILKKLGLPKDKE
jgi:tripartite-type tricarboxylate transporter receptor subunit TctC